VVTLYCYWMLRRDTTFDSARLWNAAEIAPNLLSMLAIFAFLGSLIAVGVRLYAPQLFLGFVRQRPMLWAAVMVLYPVLSVYPQGIIYRAFLMHRYAGLIPNNWMMILVSAAAFAFLHIIFRNSLAVGLTFFGGLLFAWRYQTTQSLALSALEHALYGCLRFTVGLGQYFYHGSIKLD
jgi:membrane protease YdiL (CAAX protease family)